MGLHFFILVLLIIVPLPKSTAVQVNQTRTALQDHDQTRTALQAAMGDMQLESYFGFVILLKMLSETMNSTVLGRDITFLMPDDRALSDIAIHPRHLLDFLLHHSIPKSLSFQDISHMPDGTEIPTSIPGNTIRVSSDKRSHVFINEARIVAPNLCLSSSIKCHGIHGTLQNKRRHRSKDPLPIAHKSGPGTPSSATHAPVTRIHQTPTAHAPVTRTRRTPTTAPAPAKRSHQTPTTAPAPAKRTHPIPTTSPAKRTHHIPTRARAPLKRTHQIPPAHGD